MTTGESNIDRSNFNTTNPTTTKDQPMRTIHARPATRQQSDFTLRLTGSRCRCTSCGEYFNSVSIFDLHRVGSWQDRGAHRRCLTVEEMRARGYLKNASGFWIEKSRQNARERPDRADLSGDRLKPQLVPSRQHWGAP